MAQCCIRVQGDRGYAVVNMNGKVLLNLTGRPIDFISIESLAICADLGVPITIENAFCWCDQQGKSGSRKKIRAYKKWKRRMTQ